MLAGLTGFGQRIVDVDKNAVALTNNVFYTTGGHPVSSAKYIRIAGGSPYLTETWMKGTIETPDSIEYKNLRLRLDLFENTLLYLNENNEEMVSVMPIGRVSLWDTATVRGKSYYFIHLPAAVAGEGSDKVWYQVLTAGNISLYKQYYKYKYESKAYASSVTEETIRTEERYFIETNNTLTRVKKLKDIADIVPNKKQEVADFIKKEKLGGKKDADYIAVVDYYNSL